MGYCDVIVHDPAEAMRLAKDAAAKGETLGIALIGNAAELFSDAPRSGPRPGGRHRPDLGARSAQRLRPGGLQPRRGGRAPRPRSRPLRDGCMRQHGAACRRDARLQGRRRHRLRIRQQHPRPRRGGRRDARLRDRRLRAAVHPAELRASAAGRSAGCACRAIRRTWRSPTRRRSPSFPTTSCSRHGWRWRASACRSRACRRARAGSASASATGMGLVFNRLVREGKLKGPVAMSRDHLDTGSVAQPTRETERMKDGSDADRRLAAPQRAAQRRQRRRPRLDPPGRRQRHGRLDLGRDDGHRRRQRQRRGAHRPLPLHRSGDRRRSATPTPATRKRKRRSGGVGSDRRWRMA